MKSTLKLIGLGAWALILLAGVEGFTETAKSVRGIPEQAEKRALGEDVEDEPATSLSGSRFSNFASSSDILKTCEAFSVFAGTSVTFDGPKTTIYTGDIGVSPGTSIEGKYELKKGSKQLNNDAAKDCAADQLSAFGYLDSQTCTTNLPQENLAGLTLSPGVYCTDSGNFLLTTSTLTLDGKGDPNAQFIFKTSKTVKTGTSTSFILKNGAKRANVYWKVGSALTLGTSSSFVGNVLAGTGISVDSSTEVEGRLLAQAEVTFEGSGRISQKEIPSSSVSSLRSTSAIALATLFVTIIALF